MTDLTTYDPKWSEGLPPDGADRYWLGESADGRQWLLRWAGEPHDYWCASGFIADWGARNYWPEIRALRQENAHFIVRHTPLPASRQEEADG